MGDGNDGAAMQAQVTGEPQAQGDQAAQMTAAPQDGGDVVAQAHKDYEAALAERDARIAELESEIAEVAKTAEGAEKLRAGRNAKEIMVPKTEVTGLGDYTRNVGYKTGSITYEFETKAFNYDRGIKLLADVMDVEEAGVLDCFVAAGFELQRTQVAPEADAFTFSEIAGHEGVTPATEDFADAEAEDVLASLRAATNAMDEAEVTTGSRILFITPTLKGVLDDFSLANPAQSNRVLECFSRVVEVPQTRFYSAIALNSGDGDQFGYSRAEGTYQITEDTSVVSGKTYYTKSGEQYTPVSSPASGSLSSYYELVGAGAPINFMVVERSAVIKFDKHVASRVFSPDELENLDSCMMKYRKYGIVELLDNKLDGVHVSCAPLA